MELLEGFVQLVGADFVVEEVEPLEDRLVEHSALVVVATTVEVLRVLEQGEAGLDQSRACRQVVGGVSQAFGESFAVPLDLAELGLDLDLGQVVVGGEVDEAGFPGVQRPEFCGDLLSEEPVGLVLLRDGSGEVGAYVRDESVVEPDGGVVLFDSVFDELDVDVGGVAGAFLPVAAEEVQVLGPARIDGALDDHPAGLSSPSASSAVQGAFEVVVVDAAALAGG